MNKIIITNKTSNSKKMTDMIQKVIEKSLKILAQKDILMDVYLVSDSEMKFINFKFRRKNKATNVLTFREANAFPHPETNLKLIGEMYLAPNYIIRKKENIILMVAHGVLHLLGYTHSKKNDTIKMERQEKKILTEINLTKIKQKLI